MTACLCDSVRLCLHSTLHDIDYSYCGTALNVTITDTMADPNLNADVHTPDRGPAVFVVTTVTLVVASVFVASRVISRWFIVKNVTWDDSIMMLAWLIAFFLSFTIDLGTYNGLGRHDENISDDEWATLRRCEYAFSILYVRPGHSCPLLAIRPPSSPPTPN